MSRSAYDVVVVGAGPAGSALAIRLAQTGYAVGLFEASRFDKPRVGESLAPAVQPLLRSLGVWDDIVATEPLPSWGTRSVWAGPAPDLHSHLANPYGRGWHVDRRAFDEALARAAQSRGVELSCGTRVSGATFVDGRWVLDLEGSDGDERRRSQAHAAVLVDVSGRSGRVGRMLGARRMVFDHLVAVGRIWSGFVADDACVVVEAVPEGWWYSAPVPSGGLITLLMTDADICRRQRLATQTVWDAALGRSSLTLPRTHDCISAESVRSHAACSGRSLRSDQRPWLSLGDAALAVDPLSGSGVTRALRMAQAAETTVAQLVDAVVDGDGDGGVTAIIGAYENERNNECHRYLHERLDFYAAGPQIDSVFWSRRRQVAAKRAMAPA